MPKLNLDIFSSEVAMPSEGKGTGGINRSNRSGAQQESSSDTSKNSDRASAPSGPSPKFIPVGFYIRQLSLLDDAVLKLRRNGYWKASKSEIIRNLIEAHADDLERFGRSNE